MKVGLYKSSREKNDRMTNSETKNRIINLALLILGLTKSLLSGFANRADKKTKKSRNATTPDDPSK